MNNIQGGFNPALFGETGDTRRIKNRSMPRSICTLFHRAENVHLIKDVGMIPYYFHTTFGMDACVATYRTQVGKSENLRRSVAEPINGARKKIKRLFRWRFHDKSRRVSRT